MNVELRFPLPGVSNKLSGAIFVDAGRLRDRIADNVDAPGLRVTPGFGVRLGSPLGPIRLDIAYNPYPPDKSVLYEEVRVDEDTTELVEIDDSYAPERDFFSRWRIHLSVGQPF
jgi:outer membrane protein assembly factor BamA